MSFRDAQERGRFVGLDERLENKRRGTRCRADRLYQSHHRFGSSNACDLAGLNVVIAPVWWCRRKHCDNPGKSIRAGGLQVSILISPDSVHVQEPAKKPLNDGTDMSTPWREMRLENWVKDGSDSDELRHHGNQCN
jgi:hypothetical protein